ncbi:hypothetical protein F0562_031177 [Nyssa sinensis]|uniref:Uncharacterized protein n=1 Tax=Nyssa sinensis TaxID=561372 RepID=A0A5J5ASS1_9ASTE|nr:hypothetical protein F0562_031177 [Nyssa sinensis]
MPNSNLTTSPHLRKRPRKNIPAYVRIRVGDVGFKVPIWSEEGPRFWSGKKIKAAKVDVGGEQDGLRTEGETHVRSGHGREGPVEVPEAVSDALVKDPVTNQRVNLNSNFQDGRRNGYGLINEPRPIGDRSRTNFNNGSGRFKGRDPWMNQWKRKFVTSNQATRSEPFVEKILNFV